MSVLLATLMDQLNTYGNFTFFGADGFVVNAWNLCGVYSLEVLNPEGHPVLNCYSELPRILAQVKAHA